MTFAPHGSKGPIFDDNDDFRNRRSHGIPSEDIGAAGGNIGLLDGSATWEKIADMKIYRASYPHRTDACFGAW